MKVRVGVEMLATLIVLFLALGASDGVVMNKCELGDELNTTLPANLLDQITNLLAKIVCHVELSSHFNTSTINHVIGPNVHSFIRGGRGGRKGRSAESSTEESSEEDSDSSNGAGHRKRSRSRSSSEESSEEDIKVPKPYFNSSTVHPVTRPQGNNSSSRDGHRGRKGRSAESSSKESSEEDSDSSNGAGRRKRSRFRSSSEESSEENIKVLKPNFNSSTVHPVTRPQGNKSSSREGHRGRKGRSAESSSEESSEEDIKVPKANFNSSTVHPVTRPQGNKSSSRDGHRGRKGRSAESSTEESSEEDSDSSNGEGHQKRSRSRSSSEESNVRNMWTLYGLFQLPDRIACTSGSEPSLNLCSMACDSLIDDNIRDDITCVETILNNMLSAANSPGPTKAFFSKLYADFFQKECKNVEDFEYFSTC
ncbi:hypothetical protein AMELA_G00233760 [Ameiurus melas]|uniref:Glycosyl hydrolases family 22 (GH22) domain-containing protein n=1 Tax=Ameiurus melas TaxID=219545 RepID=A0A7J6A0C4_AMEME|nr:hypothetical protein AMELA_G00233760 [Ameiurus melas]